MDARTQMAPGRQGRDSGPVAADAALCAAHQNAFQTPSSAPPPSGASPYYYTAQPPKRQRGLIIAVVAAIVIAGALIAGAILIKGGGGPGPAPVPAIASPGQPTGAASVPGGTCAAWVTAKTDLGAVTRLPAGWDYSTPGIDQAIAARSAQLKKVLAVFESQIQPTPIEVASAAQLFVEKQRAEADKLVAHSFDAADLAAIEAAEKSLNRACG